MSRHTSRHWAAIVGSITLGVLLVSVGVSPAAGENDDDIAIEPINIPIYSPSGTPTQIYLDGTGSIEVTPGSENQTVAAQCVPMDGNTLCLGKPSAVNPQEELSIGGLSDFLMDDQSYLDIWNDRDKEQIAAFGWILREAIDAVTALYGLPADGRVERYAGDQIRAYMVSRVVDIFDRFIFGEELTYPEQVTFNFLKAELAQRDADLARYALFEYQLFMSDECGYQPPPAPAFVVDPVPLPATVTRFCTGLQSQIASVVAFAPPLPSVADFQAWAMYRHADDLGLGGLNSPELQDAYGDTQRSLYGYAAVALAGGAVAAVTAGVVTGLSATVGTAVVGAIGGGVAFVPTAFMAAQGVVFPAITTVSAVSSASFVAIIVTAVIISVVSIIQVAERESIGNTLSDLAGAAVAAQYTDPYGFLALQSVYSGYALRDWPSDTRPDYQSTHAVSRIIELVTRTTSARFAGAYVPDTPTLWTNNETTASDIQFIVTDSTGTHAASSLAIPILGVDTTVRFSTGWMIVDSGNGEEAALEFGFVNPEGLMSLASRSAVADGGFVVATANADGTLSSEIADSFQYRDAQGGVVTVALVGDSTSGLAGPRPSAVGPLTPGRTVILRPNPVDLDGTFGLERYTTGYAYVWDISRYETTSQAWVAAAPSANSYDTRFIPTEVGNYRASVLMHDTDPLDGIDDDVWGWVEFAVGSPELEISTLTLTDDGTDELQLTAQLANQVPNNDFTLTVTWPGTVTGEPGPTSTVHMECIEVDALSCTSVNTALFPELSGELQYTLPHDAALSQGVQVEIADDFGGGLTRTIPIASAARPTFEAPAVAPGADQPGTVVFDSNVVTVQVPVAFEADPNYEIARIVPGTGGAPTTFGIVDPDDGLPHTSIPLPGGGGTLSAVYDDELEEWAIILRVTGGTSDLGSRIIPVVVQQVTGARNTIPLSLDLVPALGDQYRGAVGSDIDPTDFTLEAVPTLVPYVMGGRAEWGSYNGELCVRFVATLFGAPPIDRCGPVDSFAGEDGSFTPVDFADFDADGLAAGGYEVSAWIPAGERADAAPIAVSFYLVHGPPTISDLAWDATTRTVTFDVDPADDAVPIETYACTIDGAPVDCTDADEGLWSASGLAGGVHTFALSVVDAGGNYTTASLEFTADPSFGDVTPDSEYFEYIEWMYAQGISNGYLELDGSHTFHPLENVSRQATAAFLYRLAGSPSFTPPGPATFSDVAVGIPFFTEIEWLNATGVTHGNADGTFGPIDPVSRQAVAAFLYRTSGSPAFTPPTAASFTDVPVGVPFFTEIEWMKSEGIATGYDNGDGTMSFHPIEAVTRQSMAEYLFRMGPEPLAARQRGLAPVK